MECRGRYSFFRLAISLLWLSSCYLHWLPFIISFGCRHIHSFLSSHSFFLACPRKNESRKKAPAGEKLGIGTKTERGVRILLARGTPPAVVSLRFAFRSISQFFKAGRLRSTLGLPLLYQDFCYLRLHPQAIAHPAPAASGSTPPSGGDSAKRAHWLHYFFGGDRNSRGSRYSRGGWIGGGVEWFF